jgi:putative membrane protein
MPIPSPTPEDPRVRFAAERTLLAWIRTGLAMMGFGFVVARFGLFLHELSTLSQRPRPTGWSQGLGVGLIVLGVLVSLLAAGEYRRVLARIDRGEPYSPPRWSLGLVVAVLLAALGVGMVGYLLQV